MTIAVIGDDKRQQALAQLLKKQYDTLYLCGRENSKQTEFLIKLADVIILPLPFTRDNIKISSTDFYIKDFLSFLRPETIIFGGMTDTINLRKNVIDYNLDEEFTLKNAFYTAEGAVALSIENTDYSLENAEILILGNGRIGKFLSKMLGAFCKNITVSARKKKDFDYIALKGFNSVNTPTISDLSKYDIIFNTIPEKALSDKAISTISENTLTIDLASKNSGLSAAKNYIDAKSLPSKFCACSSAEALFNSVDKYLKANIF